MPRGSIVAQEPAHTLCVLVGAAAPGCIEAVT